MDTGENTVDKTEGWVAPDGASPFTHYISGYAAQGNTPFLMPVITRVRFNLYHGGYVENLDLGDNFDVVVSLYPWETYPTKGTTKTVLMYDGGDVDEFSLGYAAGYVEASLAQGKRVLVHCQAGLNRSSLVVGQVLMNMGMTPENAIKTIRENRSPACLCNKTFESWLLSHE